MKLTIFQNQLFHLKLQRVNKKMIGKLVDVTNFNRQQAVEFIRTRCTDCDIYHWCNGADAKICNDKVDYLLDKFRREE